MTTDDSPHDAPDDAPRRPRMRRSSVLLVLLLVAAAALVAVDAAPTGNLHTGDTDIVVHGARVALDCVHLGTWRACGRTEADRSDVGPYPLLQYLPAAALAKLSRSDDTVVRGLGRLNFVAFVALVCGAGLLLSRRDRRAGHAAHRPLALAILVISPLWYYATAGFGEMLSVAALVALVLATVERRPWWILGAAFVAGISKETLPWFALSLVILLATTEDDRWTPPRRVLAPAVGGSLAAFAVNSLFNQFRYGTFDNPFYLREQFRVPGAGRAVRQYLMIVGSPNAGIVAFWPLLLPAAGLAVAALVRARRGAWPQRLRRLALVAWPAAFVATAAVWFSPFGWIAWGPRLEVPVLPAWAIGVILVAPRAHLDAVARWVARPTRLAGTALVAVVLVLAPAAAPWSYGAAIQALIEADGSCPALTQVAIERDAAQYYRCAEHAAWRRPGKVLLRSADPPTGAARAAQVVAAAAVVLLALELAGAGLATATTGERPADRGTVEVDH